MKPKESWPAAVFMAAHLSYPVEVGKAGLYGVAFFGHRRPEGVVRTTESVWRGCCRASLKAYCAQARP